MSSSSTTGTGTGLRRRRWRSRAVRRGVSMSVLFAVGLGTAFGAKPARQLVWRTEASRWVARLDPADSSRTVAAAPRFELGDLSSNRDLVYSESAPQAAASVLRWVRPARRETSGVEVGAGRTPRLLRLRHGGFISITFGVDATGRTLPFASGSREIESAWKSPVAISARAGVPSLGSGRLVETRDGVVLVPIAWHIPDSPAATQIVIHASRDGGARWEEIGSIEAVQDAALAPLQDGQIVAICRQGTDLSRCTSTDGGRSWSALQPLGIASRPGPFAFVNDASSNALGLAWTDIDPDTTVALPALQELRFALSKNAGATWQRTRVLALHPGRVPVEPVLQLAKDKLTAAYVERPAIPGEPGERILCMEYSRDWLVSNHNPIERRESRYGIDPVAAREALRIYCAHTINRPAAARALFVDGYHMRTLAAAHAVFDSLPAENPEWFDPKAGLETALRWADALVQKQDSIGYFPIGYGAVFLADMAASLGVFPALEPYAGEARLREYEATVRRFTNAMQQDRMIAPSGAVGIGWPGSFYPRAPKRVRRDAYLVSTALAGIELHAWLYHRSGAAADRDAALRSLDYTLSQLQPDGAFPRSPMIQSKTESHITAAAYVEEGWIAADVYLKDPTVLAKLKAALPPHVTWLLQTQRADGGWGGEEDGEFARTPAIVDFLIWYDQRCESRPEVRDAIRRAGLRFVDPAQLEAIGFYQSKPYLAVQRAITGRALVAMSRERFVP